MTRVLLLLLLVGLVSGCRTLDPGRSLPLADPRPEKWMMGLVARVGEPQAIRARARLDLDAPDLSFDRPQRMAVERPARLRFEVLGLFDQLAAVVVTDGARYQVYDARRGDLEEGRVGSDLLWRVARIDLDPSRAVQLLLGGVMPTPGLTLSAARIFENGQVSFARVDSRGLAREGYRFDAQGQLLEASHFDDEGRLLWQATYADYRPVERPDGSKGSFAHELKLNFPRVGAQARLRYSVVKIESELPDSLFQLPRRDSSRMGVGDGQEKWVWLDAAMWPQ